MSLFTVEELLEVISVKVLAGRCDGWLKRRIARLCTDSRSVCRGDLFVALKGERFDGHQFVEAALRRGAVGAIVEDQYRPSVASLTSLRRQGTKKAEPLLFGVRDTLFAYQQLAAHHRSRFAIPVVAVTGSNGKTTTKEMVASVLARRWTVLKTEGNLNNRIGVPQTVLRLTPRHEAAVIELGVDQKGQTTRLCEIVRPTIGLITNIGPDHLEFFGSIEGSAQAKAELLDQTSPDGAVVLNADDPYFDYLAARARCRVVSFGFSPRADVRALDVRTDARTGAAFRLVLPGKARPTAIALRVHGVHNVANALAAAAVGYVLSLGGVTIAQGLMRFRPAAMRTRVGDHHGVRVIDDCYNANPASMKAAIELLAELGSSKRTIAVLGDMLELGPDARALHEDVGAFLAQRNISLLVACGALGKSLAEGARRGGMVADRILEVPDAGAAAIAVKSLVRKGDVVLVKASRGMKMEQVVEALAGSGRRPRGRRQTMR